MNVFETHSNTHTHTHTYILVGLCKYGLSYNTVKMDCVRVQVVREYHSICLPLLLGCYRMLHPL